MHNPLGSLPILLDFKCPREFQMSHFIVIDKFADGAVFASSQHACGCGVGFEFLFIGGLFGCVGGV